MQPTSRHGAHPSDPGQDPRGASQQAVDHDGARHDQGEQSRARRARAGDQLGQSDSQTDEQEDERGAQESEELPDGVDRLSRPPADPDPAAVGAAQHPLRRPGDGASRTVDQHVDRLGGGLVDRSHLLRREDRDHGRAVTVTRARPPPRGRCARCG